MNLDHLGDAFDHWKGSLIRLLQTDLTDLHILPMITDAPASWNGTHFELYARLLNVDVGVILNQGVKVFPKDGREKYFRVNPGVDLFLDPDTGVKEKPSAKHITPAEMAKLLPEGSGRVLLIYQHKQRNKNREGNKEHLTLMLKNLSDKISGGRVFAYFVDQTSMIFVSRDSGRLDRVWKRLEDFLGPSSKDRLIKGGNLADVVPRSSA